MKLEKQFAKLKNTNDYFKANGIADIYTNSKIYELVIAEQLGHQIINGHANTPDACDENNRIYEYKHYKKSSGNHTWTFNDFSRNTIKNLNSIDYVIFASIDDRTIIPYVNKIYLVKAKDVAKYLKQAIQYIENNRDMINISPRQIEKNLKHIIIYPEKIKYTKALTNVFLTINQVEKNTGIQGLLTSNKIWELLVAQNLYHKINSEQKKHDATDKFENTYEYKISGRGLSWTFQDISDNVLNSYLQDKAIVLAVVDKVEFIVKRIYVCDSASVVYMLRNKLVTKINKNGNVKRLSVSFGKRNLETLLERGKAYCHL